MQPGFSKHFNCINNIYPKSSVKRFIVPENLIFWSSPYPNYDPPDHTASHIKGQVWADPDINDEFFHPVWHGLDGVVNRKSLCGVYVIENKTPKNIIGRTGLKGRGLLGRWGPNEAADPIVTRWKRFDDSGAIVTNSLTGKKILQMIAIQRHDNKKWAIPGGMVDPGEKISTTLKREFMEEALNTTKDYGAIIDKFFSTGVEVYKGYVDDFRNTDNAWMETVAYNFHDEAGDKISGFKLTAGDDAANVKWIDLERNLDLHANHISMIEKVAQRLGSHW